MSNQTSPVPPPATENRDDTRRIVARVAIDIAILASVAFAIQLVYLVWRPFERGFFCGDQSLMYPYREPSINGGAFFAIGTMLPFIVLIGTELARSRVKSPSRAQPLRLRRLTVPFWLVEAYKSVGTFGFGATSCQLLTLVAKFTVGRLRPHFFDVCRPVLPDGTSCGDAANRGRYQEDFYCTNGNSTDDVLQQVRMSFPSGQASIAVYSVVYCAVYLQARLNWRGSMLLKHFLQLTLVLIGYYSCLSRVSDYRQHWSDVVAGAALGAVVAAVTLNCWTSLWSGGKQRKGRNEQSEGEVSSTNGGIENPVYVSAA